jgi:UDP-N-acetylglucosamine 4,6-dehydratase/5-epimerase
MILVTGGTGSFGHALAAVYPALRILSRDEEKQREMALQFPEHEYVVGDVRDPAALRRAMRGVGVVIHAAALKQVPTGERFPSEVVRTNVTGTENVIEAADGRPVVLLSTDKAVEPVNAYGASKMLAEHIVLAAGGSVVRYGNVLGSRGSIVPVFRAQVAAGEPITITHPDMTRFVMTLGQAVELVDWAINGPGLYVHRDSPAATVAQFAEAIAPGYPTRIIGIRPGEKMHESLGDGVTSDRAPQLTTETLADMIRAL